MKDFKTLNNELKLVRYLGSRLGTMYFEPDVSFDKESIIRHLDGELTVNLLPLYLSLYSYLRDWIETSKMNTYLYLPDLLEVGIDYIVRPFYVYHISLSDYYHHEEPEEPPLLFYKMQDLLLEELDKISQEKVLKNVLKKSLLKATGKTYFEYSINKFIIVEPKISIQDLWDWKFAKQRIKNK